MVCSLRRLVGEVGGNIVGGSHSRAKVGNGLVKLSQTLVP